MKVTGGKITQEAVDNFCVLTGCKVVMRGGGRPRAKHLQITLNGRRLFFVKKTSSMRRLMELYERAMQPKLELWPNYWTAKARWSSCPTRNLQNLPRMAIDLEVCGNLIHKANIHERLANASQVPVTDRRQLLGYDGGHGVPPVRSIVVEDRGSDHEESLRGQDRPGIDGADVAPSDSAGTGEEAETSWVNVVLPQPHRGEPKLSQAVQNLLDMHNLTARIRIDEMPGARYYKWVVYSSTTAKKLGEITAAANIESWIKFINQMEKISG